MDEKVITLRLPKQMYNELKKKAAKNVRSANSEIIVAIQRHLTGGQPAENATRETSPEATA